MTTTRREPIPAVNDAGAELKCITINQMGYLMQRTEADGSWDRYYVMPRKMTPSERAAGKAQRDWARRVYG
jgi:hypothetical protein